MFPHFALVQRSVSSVVNAEETDAALTTLATALPCLAEGLTAWRQQSVFGDVGGHTLTFSWDSVFLGAVELRDGDLVTLSHKSGKVYSLKLDTDDTNRPDGMTTIQAYQTGFLFQEDVQRV